MKEKPLRWLHGKVKTPPMSIESRREIGMLLRDLQEGEKLSLPQSRPMPALGKRCHELRVNDEDQTWRLVYRLDPDAIVVLEVFGKKSTKTPKSVIDTCQRRLKAYEVSKS
jgi:phage-related protein